MEPLKIIRDLYLENEIEGNLDVRLTMTHNGIRVNFGMDTNSTKPSTFDLQEAILISAKASVAETQKRMKHNTKNSDLLWHYTKQLKFFNDVVKHMSPKPTTQVIDKRIPGVGC